MAHGKPLAHDLCARIQNAFRARHAHVAVAHSRTHLGVLSVLLRAGFISSISRSALASPSSSSSSTLSIPVSGQVEEGEREGERAAAVTEEIPTSNASAPSPLQFLTAPSPALQRIVATLKYRDARPVLHELSPVSRPGCRVNVDNTGLRLLCSGRRARNVKPLGMGEVAVIRTNDREHEWLEAREALKLGLGGEIICRAR